MKRSFLVCALYAASHAIKLSDLATDLTVVDTVVPDATGTVDVVQLDAAPEVVPATVVSETVVADPAVVDTVVAEPVVVETIAEPIVVETVAAEPEVIIEDTSSLEDFFPDPETTIEETIEMADLEEGLIPAVVTTTTVTESTVQMMEPELVSDAIVQVEEQAADAAEDGETAAPTPEDLLDAYIDPMEEPPKSEEQVELESFLYDVAPEIDETDEDDTVIEEEEDLGEEDLEDIFDDDSDLNEGDDQEDGAVGEGGALGDKLDECTEGFDELPEETQTELTDLFGDVTSQMNAILEDDAALV